MTPAVNMEEPRAEARRKYFEENSISENCRKKFKPDVLNDFTYSKCKSFLDSVSTLKYYSKDSCIYVEDAKSCCLLLKQYFKSKMRSHSNSNHSDLKSYGSNSSTNHVINGNHSNVGQINSTILHMNKAYYDVRANDPRTMENFLHDSNIDYSLQQSQMTIRDESFGKKFMKSMVPMHLQSTCRYLKGIDEVKNDNSFIINNLDMLNSGLQSCQDFVVSGRGNWKINKSLLLPSPEIPLLNGSSLPQNSLLQTALQAKQEIEGVEYMEQKINKNTEMPPDGPYEKKPLDISSKVFAMKGNLLGAWLKAVIVKKEVQDGETKFKVRFDRTSHTRWCTKKMVAYDTAPNVRLEFLQRVIALFTPEDKTARPAFYAGVIGEIAKGLNQFRYLIFFDDGIVQYVKPENVRVVYEESKNVWDDVAEESREVIKKMKEDFPEKVLLRVKKGQVIKIEYNGRWVYAKVQVVDGSMVKLLFDNDRRYEWLYRGSTRLETLFKELENAKQNQRTGRVRRHFTPGKNRENQPFVEYRQNTDVDEIVLDSDSDSETKKEEDGDNLTTSESEPVKRNVAKKSTSQVKKFTPSRKTPSIKEYTGGRIETIIEDHLYSPLSLKKHSYATCTRLCLKENNVIKYIGENPLCIPIRFGFERRNGPFRRRGAQRNNIYYRAPCGRMLRSKADILHYLSISNCQLTIDMFSMDPEVIPNRCFKILPNDILWSADDITEGVEKFPIPAVNCLTNQPPPYVAYANEPFPGRGVKLDFGKDFLCGCDCTDNCEDSSKCQCQILTCTLATKKGDPPAKVGYKYRRLGETVLTAIYECSSACSCKKSCVNRVVQNGIQCRLQMFKTAKKGWGVRTLDDLDAGTFLTIYAGQVQTDQAADEDGKKLGDEYLADLDHIEVAEASKEGYESEAYESEVDNFNSNNDHHSDEDAASSKSTSSASSDSPPEGADYSDSDYEDLLGSLAASETIYTTRSKTKKKSTSFSNLCKNTDNKENSSNDGNTTNGEHPNNSIPGSTTNSSASFGTKHTGGAKKSSGAPRSTLPPPSNLRARRSGAFKIRSYYNERDPYIMDAKIKGNIGRYLNHSCNPNSFVQNVFVDTHDLRFPTVAFFTGQHITAGTELTWDYSYEIGSVQGKKLVCYCGTSSCRGRLL